MTNDKAALESLKIEVQNKVNLWHLNDVDKVTEDVVKEANGHLKNNKTDPIYAFTSDCIKKGPDILFKYLWVVIRSFLVHGHITVFPSGYFSPDYQG